ncbi:Uncharacterized protein OS=Ralstonia metallidurans (strain CH34 / ATCC 43123 / DSM 2839) GN=Rmet_6154 PE=4 SV=1 [Gemmataceae bacterium]|nr:Uncharacterized protein OS=Ralstonia metallidurans (strain CH34 / ATCC 43123 / DSM 2839) GN=Rmet_6154 PE=4 SV=1 [Gemmataceae bacterium]VTU01166.1 Uncharacterized protein OS=Ralstonia metallidurans (strain CH34 / ATCC 43123 / DSM 2839) GN=Rmet_6154 PE=4 SV=1 [Gemmataceae bacterium]
MEQVTDEYVLAAYADGSDLHDVAPALREAFGHFLASGWSAGTHAVLVDSQFPPDPSFPDYLPQWDLGLSLGLDQAISSPERLGEVDSLVSFLRDLSRRTGREFVLFMCFRSHPELQEHLCFVGDNEIDLGWLRDAILRLAARARGA